MCENIEIESDFHKKNLQKSVNFIEHILAIWNDSKESISLENVQKIADALNIKTYLLFIDEGEESWMN